MKKFFADYGRYAVILLAVWSFFSGCAEFFVSFGKPEGSADKYPLFMLTITLIALYAVPLILLTRYLAKRFGISKRVTSLSWILGLTSAFYFSRVGHTIVALFWLGVVKPSDAFIENWGAAVSAPFAEEFGKGLAVLIILVIAKKLDVKNALVSGMIVGLAFQIIEDCIFTFQAMFIEGEDGFSTLLERIVHAGGTHWVFSLLFAVGMVALIGKNTGLPRWQGALWLLGAIAAHFLVNSPFNEGITSDSGKITILILSFNLCLALAAIKVVDKVALPTASPTSNQPVPQLKEQV